MVLFKEPNSWKATQIHEKQLSLAITYKTIEQLPSIYPWSSYDAGCVLSSFAACHGQLMTTPCLIKPMFSLIPMIANQSLMCGHITHLISCLAAFYHICLHVEHSLSVQMLQRSHTWCDIPTHTTQSDQFVCFIILISYSSKQTFQLHHIHL